MVISPFPELGEKSRYPDSRLFASHLRGTKPQWWRTSLQDSPRQDKRRFTSVKMVVIFSLAFFVLSHCVPCSPAWRPRTTWMTSCQKPAQFFRCHSWSLTKCSKAFPFSRSVCFRLRLYRLNKPGDSASKFGISFEKKCYLFIFFLQSVSLLGTSDAFFKLCGMTCWLTLTTGSVVPFKLCPVLGGSSLLFGIFHCHACCSRISMQVCHTSEEKEKVKTLR